MPIFRVKSVKIYTGQKKFTRIYSWRSWQIWGMSDSWQIQYEDKKRPKTALYKYYKYFWTSNWKFLGAVAGMFLITRFCKPLDLLYCRFKSNQNTFLNKGKHTKIFLFLNRTFVSQKCLLEFFVDNLFLLDLIHCTTCFLIFQPCGYLCTPPPQSRFFAKH